MDEPGAVQRAHGLRLLPRRLHAVRDGNIPAPEFGIFSPSDYVYRVSEVNFALYGSEIGAGGPSGAWAAQQMAPQPSSQTLPARRVRP